MVHGNQKENFNNRITDKDLIVLAEVLEPYAIYIEDIDLRYNHINDGGAEALSRLVQRASRLLGLNLQGNSIGIEGSQSLAESLKKCELLQYLNLNGNSI